MKGKLADTVQRKHNDMITADLLRSNRFLLFCVCVCVCLFLVACVTIKIKSDADERPHSLCVIVSFPHLYWLVTGYGQSALVASFS